MGSGITVCNGYSLMCKQYVIIITVVQRFVFGGGVIFFWGEGAGSGITVSICKQYSVEIYRSCFINIKTFSYHLGISVYFGCDIYGYSMTVFGYGSVINFIYHTLFLGRLKKSIYDTIQYFWSKM